MNSHLDMFLALVAIVGFGHAHPFEQSMQQRQQNRGGTGGTFPAGLDGGFPRALGGRPGDSSGSRFGMAPAALGGAGDRASTGGSPDDIFGSSNGGGMGAPSLGAAFEEGRAGGPLSPGGGIAAGRGSGTAIFGGGGTPGVGSGFQAGPLSGSHGPGALPGLDGAFPSSSDALSAVGSGSSTLGGVAGPPFGSGPGQRDSGPGAEGRLTSQPPVLPSGPAFGSGNGASGVGPAGQGFSHPASVGGSGGPGATGSPVIGPNWQPSDASGTSGSGRPGAPGSTASGTQGASGIAGGPSSAGNGLSPTRPSGKPHNKPLTQAEKAALGLGLTGGLLAIGALSAAIAGAVQQAQKQRRQGKPGQGGGAPSQGIPKPLCTNGCGRHRRSIRESRVPAEILNSISMDFERLY